MRIAKLKICGIRSVEELQSISALDIDAFGVLVGQVHSSPDFVSPDVARSITQRAHPFLNSVLVTHLETTSEIVALCAQVPSASVQVHSDMSAANLAKLRALIFPRKVIGKVSVEDDRAMRRALEIQTSVDALLLDTIARSNDQVGGTGRTHDWSISAKIVAKTSVPIILAGGLNATNISDALRTVKPSAIDINSGAKRSDGSKSIDKVAELVRVCKSTEF